MLYDIYDEQMDVTVEGVPRADARLRALPRSQVRSDPARRDYYSLIIDLRQHEAASRTPKRTCRSCYFTPLVPHDEYETVPGVIRTAVERKQMEIEDVVEQREGAPYAEQLTPRLAEYMLAARRVYADKAAAAAAATRRVCDESMLEKWVEVSEARSASPDRISTSGSRPTPETRLTSPKRYTRRVSQNGSPRGTRRSPSGASGRGKMPTEMNMPPPPRPSSRRTRTASSPRSYFRTAVRFALPEKRSGEAIHRRSARADYAKLGGAGGRLRRKPRPPEPDMACAVAEGDPRRAEGLHPRRLQQPGRGRAEGVSRDSGRAPTQPSDHAAAADGCELAELAGQPEPIR